MIVLRMAGKILLLPVWLLLATTHLLVKIAVEIYCIGKGIINLILGFMLIGTLLWYRQWERFALAVTSMTASPSLSKKMPSASFSV